jgi:Inner membrane protein CreD
MKRLFVIGVIWFFCAAAWVVLGSTVVYRSGNADNALTNEVNRLWGPPLEQAPLRATYQVPRKVSEVVTNYDSQGHPFSQTVEKQVMDTFPVELASSNITAKLALEHRRKGLMWFPTYAVDFRAVYRVHNDSGGRHLVEVTFPLSEENAGFDGFEVVREDGTPVKATISRGGAQWSDDFEADRSRLYTVAYRTRGTSSWTYGLTATTGQAKDFKLNMDTDFAAVDFPAGAMSPTHHGPVAGGWHGTWEFKSLIASNAIAVTLPARINPGPLASRITFFAPVGLLFFFFVVAVFAAAAGRDLHPLNYFFLGCAFFAFHLLFAYLVDHLEIGPAFAASSAVSIFLVVTYARLFVGWKFALREMGIAQLIYLVLFSFTFMWEGFTGLAITVGAILTLFVMMQVTGRVKWSGEAAEPVAAR